MLKLGAGGGFLIDALGDFLCTQAITTKEYNSSSETGGDLNFILYGECQQVFYTLWWIDTVREGEAD